MRRAGLAASVAALLVAVALAVALHVATREEVLLDRVSAFHHIQVVERDDGLRVLRFSRGAEQSAVKPGDPDHLEFEYVRAMPIALALVPNARHILVVGLGGGTVPSFLHKRVPDAVIDVVELDPEVVDAARRFFDFREDDRLRVFVGDGRAFIEGRRGEYDLVLLDAYGAESVPHSLATAEFLQAVRRALAPRGAVASNLWAGRGNPLYDAMVQTYLASFEGVAVLEVPRTENRIVLATPWGPLPEREAMTARAGALNRRLELRHDLAKMVGEGYRTAMPHLDGAAVLRDGIPAPAAAGR